MTQSEAGKLGWLASLDKLKTKNKQRVLAYNANPKLCKKCKKPIPYLFRGNVFCDHSCAASHNNLGVRRHGVAAPPCKIVIKKVILNSCLFCGKSTKNKVFCSKKCENHNRSLKAEGRWQKKNNEILSAGYVVDRDPRTAKRYLRNARGNKCEICKRSTWLKQKLPLILDHISGNSDDWLLDNLRLVCSNCDSLLPTYKSKNRGNGRHTRRLRYRCGKSF